MTTEEKMKILQMRSKDISIREIASVLNLSVNTVKSFCSRNKSSQLCLCCGTSIIQPPRTRLKKFCSDKCRMKWWNSHAHEVNRKAMYEFSCACCGQYFQAYGNKHRKYCSRACYIKSRFGGNAHGLSE